ncbi:MAG: threonine--tRNA ligase [Alphaproteobacteria bacterium 41-28]|nr:MAG: threonine--tRNA ligase [Alphaproteobacteria bacterium 41-28]
MITIRFPDGSNREFPKGITGWEIAKTLSTSLVKEAVAVRIQDELWDLTRPIESDAAFEVIKRNSDTGLDILRHDAAHVFAEAVKELYPEAQITIGPSIQDGFYYDLYREESFTPEDLKRLEERMHEIVNRDEPLTREVWDRKKAIEFFKSQGELFKAEIIEDLPPGDEITIYRQGNFVDLCRGPHLPSTGKLGHAFKLMKIAGAYWRGDQNNPVLQRVYGTAWSTEKDLQDYLTRLEEAEKRDHRKLGKEMDLFHMQEEAVGSVFWHPKGWTLYRLLENYIRDKISQEGYEEVKTPQLLDKSFWETSGHWEKFRDSMFVVEDEDKTLALKPMNCPCHIQIFRQGLKSYRDLPIRMAEFGACMRNERSGALQGLTRVRSMVQDDAHIFCREDQLADETRKFCLLLLNVYRELGFEEVVVKFADRPPVRAGEDAVWDKAEAQLEAGARKAGLSYTLNPGEGAFYGPKLEFILKDAIGRDWQCGTLQLDFVMPERLDASYIGEDGKKYRPAMLHRAILGTLERFIAIFIEHYAGKFPLWIAPVQAVVATITQEGDDYARKVFDKLKAAGLRAELDLRNEKINYKVRELSLQKIPYILVVGKREAEAETVALRKLGGEAQEILALDAVIDKLTNEAIPPHKRNHLEKTEQRRLLHI